MQIVALLDRNSCAGKFPPRILSISYEHNLMCLKMTWPAPPPTGQVIFLLFYTLSRVA